MIRKPESNAVAVAVEAATSRRRMPLRVASPRATVVSEIAVAKAIQCAADAGKTLTSTINQSPRRAVRYLSAMFILFLLMYIVLRFNYTEFAGA
jgi:hypothetical protein